MTRSLTFTVAAATVSLIVGIFISPLVMIFHDSWPENTTLSADTEPASTFAATELGDGLTRPADCPAHTPTFACTVVETTSQIHREVTVAETFQDTSDPAKRSRLQATATVTMDGTKVFALDDSVTINRESAIAVPQPVSQMRASFPLASKAELNTGDFSRTGIQYSFEPDTQKRSYEYFDPLLQDTFPLDYSDTIEQGDYEFYEYRQQINAHPLRDSILRAYAQPQEAMAFPPALSSLDHDILDESATSLYEQLAIQGQAGDFYTSDELGNAGLSAADTVIMQPYYSVDRLVWVEPMTGHIVNIDEHINIFLAADASLAENSDPAAESHPRAIFATHAKYDEASRQAALDQASGTISLISTMETLSFILHGIGIAFIGLACWIIWRRRQARVSEFEARETTA